MWGASHISFHLLGNRGLSYLWHFYVGFMLFCPFIGRTYAILEQGQGQPSLIIEVHTVRPTSVDLVWSSHHANNSVLQKSAICDVVVWSSVDKKRHILENYSLQHHIIHIKFLMEKMNYTMFLHCPVQGTNTVYQSNVVHFTTGSRALMPVETTSLSTVTSNIARNNVSLTEDKRKAGTESGYTGGKLDIQHTADDSPTIYKHKLSAFSSVLDATLGIVFAVFGGIVALVTACYVWKGWQRRQRFQRFMRHQDSSDQFDIIRQNIAESS